MPALLMLIAVKASLVFALTWIAARAMRRLSAAARHLVWTLGIAAALLLPIVGAATPAWEIRMPASTIAGVPLQKPLEATPVAIPAASHLDATVSVPGMSTSAGHPPGRRLSFPAVLLILWMGGAIVALLKLLAGLWRAHSVAAGSTIVDEVWWLADAIDAAAALELHTPIPLRRTARTVVPLVCGVWRPVILLPVASDDWSAERRRVVLLHELAHVKRHDCAALTLAWLAVALHWFNPLAHVALRQLRAEQERAADDLVLTAGTEASAYADHLLEIARAFRSSAPIGATALAMAGPSEIEGRLIDILEPSRRRRPLSRPVRTWAAVVVMLALVPIAALRLSAAAGAMTVASPKGTPALPPTDVSAPARVTTLHATAAPAAPVSVAPTSENPPAPPSRAPEASQGAPAPPVTPAFLAPPAPPAPPAPRAQRTLPDDATRKRVADALFMALDDSNERVREQALNTLATMRDERVLPALVKAMSDPSADIRRRAAAGLQQFETPQASDALIRALSDSSADVRERAASALGMQRNSRAIAALVQAMRDANANVRRRVGWALGMLADPAAIDVLTAALKDPDATVREQAAESLGRIARGRQSSSFSFSKSVSVSSSVSQEVERALDEHREELERLRDSMNDFRQSPLPAPLPAPSQAR